MGRPCTSLYMKKELMALVLTVKKWRSYVLGQTFRVQTDHQSLKYLLE
jgi:hypothetical protein